MFENILYQSATERLSADIKNRTFPSAVLFSGPASSGKLSCALECARTLLCEKNGAWGCTCGSCARVKALTSQNVLILGASDRTLEIAACAKTFSDAAGPLPERYIEAARFLYLRSVRKLTARFNPALWDGDSTLSKVTPIIRGIEEQLDLLAPGHAVPAGKELSKILSDIEKSAARLEEEFLYSSIPVLQIRNLSAWARITNAAGRKIAIIENADLMIDSAKNALLKILEEPPEGVIFILTTTRRGAILPTILSRVRTYSFSERTAREQREVLDRIFHAPDGIESVNGYLESFLKVSPSSVKSRAREAFESAARGRMPDISAIIASCASFSPRVLFRIFLQGIIDTLAPYSATQAGAEASSEALKSIRRSLNEVEVYNQNPRSALEELFFSLARVNSAYGGVFRPAGRTA